MDRQKRTVLDVYLDTGSEPDKPRTRIQEINRGAILMAALEVFSIHGFRGSTP